MIKTRIASTAAIFTFGLAALGGAVVSVAAPANAAPAAPLAQHTVGSTPATPGPRGDAGEGGEDPAPRMGPGPIDRGTTSPSAGPTSKIGSTFPIPQGCHKRGDGDTGDTDSIYIDGIEFTCKIKHRS
jgi:hypothetical protein